MNKILSQALKKAVSEYSPEVKELEKNNKPDLFLISSVLPIITTSTITTPIYGGRYCC